MRRVQVLPSATGTVVDAVPNSARRQANPLAPGQGVEIEGIEFGGTDVDLLFGDREAEIVASAPNRIPARAPADFAAAPRVRVQVRSGERVSDPAKMPTAVAWPEFFTASGTGYGQVLALNEDGTANSSASPAAKSSTVTLFLNGVDAAGMASWCPLRCSPRDPRLPSAPGAGAALPGIGDSGDCSG